MFAVSVCEYLAPNAIALLACDVAVVALAPLETEGSYECEKLTSPLKPCATFIVLELWSESVGVNELANVTVLFE